MAEPLPILVPLFLVTAFVYSMAGLGGGTLYLAILTFSGLTLSTVPIIALCCNIIVVSATLWYNRNELRSTLKFVLPFIVTSIPAAFLGGFIRIPASALQALLAGVLLCAALTMAVRPEKPLLDMARFRPATVRRIALFIGTLLGFVSGIAGIGGGIFLSPLLLLTNWESPRRVTVACSLFILFNSLSGLAGQLLKSDIRSLPLLLFPLAAAVLAGSLTGGFVSLKFIRDTGLRRVTVFVVLAASFNLFRKVLG